MKSPYFKIYIIGSVASRKAELAETLSKRLGILCYHLDDLIWERKSEGDVKREPAKRDEAFNQITLSKRWIIEDVLRPCFESALKRADLVILLDIPERNWWWKTVRWFKHTFLFRRTERTQAVQEMKSRIGSPDFKRNIPAFMSQLEPFKGKVLVLKNQNDIDGMFDELF